MAFVKGHKAWNKDLTKETDERVKSTSEKLKGNIPWNKDLTKETNDSIRRMSEKRKNIKFSEEHIKNLSISHKGRSVWITGLTKETDERVKRISESKIGQKHSEEWNKKNSESHKGEKHPLYGTHRSEETKRKISEGNKGKHYHSDESKQKNREKALLRFQNHLGPFKDTKPEIKMKEILISLNILFEHQFVLDNCSFDFHILNTSILIEVDGDYYHGNPEKFLTLNKMQLRMKERDKKHDEVALNNGYILLRFWQSDILNNKEKVIEELKNIRSL